MSLAQPYDGGPKQVSAWTDPGQAAENLEITYNGSPELPIEVGTYTVVATIGGNPNYEGSATTTMVIDNSPAVILHPQDVGIVRSGADASFIAAAESSVQPITARWRVWDRAMEHWADVEVGDNVQVVTEASGDVTTSVLTITDPPVGTYDYACVFENAAGDTPTWPGYLSVTPATYPVVTVQPSDLYGQSYGEPVSFTSTVDSPTPATGHWEVSLCNPETYVYSDWEDVVAMPG